MKKTIFIALLIFFVQVVAAQNKDACHAGVYLTKEDFISNKLSHEINKDIKGNKIEFPIPADWILTIKIITPDSVFKFKQGTIYGFYDCGKKFRYSPGGRLYAPEDFYRIEEDHHLVIYTSVFVGGNEYYYSVTPTAPIQRLNIRNLKQDFVKYPEFVSNAKKLDKEEIHGNLAKRDKDGYFILNNIYEQTVK